MEKLISLKECAEKLNVSIMTLNRWYRWYESGLNDTTLELPQIIRGSSNKRFIKEGDFYLLERFKKKLRRGMMADYNAVFSWGKKGEELLTTRNEDKEQLKKMVKDF